MKRELGDITNMIVEKGEVELDKVANKEIYQRRVIAFIDILGFKSHINKTVIDDEYKERLFKALRFILDFQKDNEEGILELKSMGKEVTVFSDSIVISYPLTIPSAIFMIMIDIIHIQLELAFKELVFRGSITIGDVHHDSNLIFGPGLVKAYELESKCAIYPRIILEEETIIEGVENRVNPNIKEELGYIFGLIKEDEDGFYYIDFLKQRQELDEDEYYILCLKTLKKVIKYELDNCTDPSIIQKYKWLKNYYNKVVNDMKLKKSLLIK